MTFNENKLYAFDADARAEVFALGRKMGFGALMHAASLLWKNQASKGAFAVGPCLGACVPCDHGGREEAYECPWCCGCGWLTKQVAESTQRKPHPGVDSKEDEA